MKPRALIAASLLAAGLAGPGPAAPRALAAQHIIGTRDSFALRADSVFRAFDRSDAPGCALGVYQDGRIVYARGYGMANLELGVAITPRTVFDVGSVSKQFAALTMLLLERDGRLSLADPVRRLIPEMPPYADSVTWLHLLSHSGGLRDYLTLMGIAGTSFEGYADTVDYLRLITRSAATNFPIGTRYLYSNTGWVLMAAATRRLTNQTIAAFADERIFRPLGMGDTRWHWDHTAIYPNRATGYAPRGSGFRIAMSQFSQFAGPGGVHTTVVDLLRWFQNYDSAWVGTREMLERMQTAGRLADGAPVPAGGGYHYGLGLTVGTYRGLRVASHGGAWAGYRAHVLRFPDQSTHVACLCNVTNAGPDTLALKVAGIYLGGRMTPDSATLWSDALSDARPAAVPAEALRRLAGWWRNDSLGEVRRTRLAGDTAVLWGTGQTTRVTLLGPRRARVRPQGQALGELTFEADSAGWPTRLVTRTRGGSLVWRRVTPPVVTAAQLAAYAGEWRSPELDMAWAIATDTAGLEVRRVRQRSPLDLVSRDVFVDRNSGALLEFERDAGGRVAGLLLQSGRVRNLRFVRAAPAVTAARE